MVSSTIVEEDESKANDVPALPSLTKLSASPSITSSIATIATSQADSQASENGRPVTADSTATAKLPEGIVMSRAELLSSPSGILVFQIVSGSLSRKGARVEVALDSGYWPAYSTEPARSTNAVFDEIGEAFIRELDVSTISLKLNTAEKETREDVIGTYTGNLVEFLDACLVSSL